MSTMQTNHEIRRVAWIHPRMHSHRRQCDQERTTISRNRTSLAVRMSILLLILAGCATSPVEQLGAADAYRLGFVEYLVDFRFKGSVTELGSGMPLRKAEVVLVDTGLGFPYGVRKPITQSDAEGRFDSTYLYWWHVSVAIPPRHPELTDEEYQSEEYQSGIYDILSHKKDYFEVWVVKDGYHTHESTFDLDQLRDAIPPREPQSFDDRPPEPSPPTLVDLGVIQLEKDENFVE